jgi:hypothetical protein
VQRAVTLLKGATWLDTKAGYVVKEYKVDEAIRILEGKEE